jgi:hypothetical protein
MNTLDERLHRIRDRLESDYLQPNPASQRPLPVRDPELDYRVERTLNMQPEFTVTYDTQGYIRALNRMLFRLKYREFFTAVSLLFHKFGVVAFGVHRWAVDKATQWGRFI